MQYSGFKYRINNVRLSDLIESPAQPERGTREKLLESMKELGQKDPIDVAPKGDRFVIMDGHGRAWAAQQLGWTEILAKVYDARTEAELATLQGSIYAAESAKLKFTGAQWVEYCHNLHRKGTKVHATDADGEYVIQLPTAARRTHKFILASYDNATQDSLVYDEGASPSAFSSTLAYCRELVHAGRKGGLTRSQENEINAEFPAAFAWVVEHGMTHPLREWLTVGRSIDTVRTCIKANKALPGYKSKKSGR
jgi:hypothetical protein